ncbi:unnamed protein product [Linum tenue]|uniref:Uncharacterized protein n=1 Tax=Linum tenue TaxID=586396 RepID=A0AAV0Q0W2_9ROSI|nr:unnamed protein product [Linum tenue]
MAATKLQVCARGADGGDGGESAAGRQRGRDMWPGGVQRGTVLKLHHGKGPLVATCCGGVRSLNGAASSTPARRED